MAVNLIEDNSLDNHQTCDRQNQHELQIARSDQSNSFSGDKRL